MDQQLEFGTVKWFDNRENKKFGFLQLSRSDGHPIGGEKDLFFHYNDFGVARFHADGTYDSLGLTNRSGYQPAIPQIGEILAFVRDTGWNGKPKANLWLPVGMLDEDVNGDIDTSGDHPDDSCQDSDGDEDSYCTTNLTRIPSPATSTMAVATSPSQVRSTPSTTTG